MKTPEEKKAYNQAYYARKKAEIIAQHRQYRATEAGRASRRKAKRSRRERRLEKVLEESRRREASPTRKAYLERNRERRKQGCREYWAKHRDRLIAQGREYQRKHREQIKAQRAGYNKRNPNQWRDWYRNNPDVARAWSTNKYLRRKALKMLAVVESDRANVAAFIRGVRMAESIQCYWCGKSLGKGRGERHIDHITPLAKGGEHAVENLCCACPHCNCSKGAKLPHEFQAAAAARIQGE